MRHHVQIKRQHWLRMIIWEIIIHYILIINTYDIPAVPGQAGGSFMRKSTPKFKNQFAYRTLFLHQHANFRLFATTTCNSSIIYNIYKQHYNQRVVLYNIHNINNIILIDCIPNSFSQDRSHSPKTICFHRTWTCWAHKLCVCTFDFRHNSLGQNGCVKITEKLQTGLE